LLSIPQLLQNKNSCNSCSIIDSFILEH
jgi:hypothetical protein